MLMGSLSLFPAIDKEDPDTLIIADGTSCRGQIEHGTGRARCTLREFCRWLCPRHSADSFALIFRKRKPTQKNESLGGLFSTLNFLIKSGLRGIVFNQKKSLSGTKNKLPTREAKMQVKLSSIRALFETVFCPIILLTPGFLPAQVLGQSDAEFFP